jgi:1-acyl-sn-glycerol-3-phosphate acyltransferase
VLGYLIFPFISVFSSSATLATQRCRHLIQYSFRAFIGFMKLTGIFTWDISGRELLTPSGQLIIANHPTLIDIVFLIAMLPNATCIVKSQLYRNIFTRGPVSRAAYVANDSPEQLVGDCVEALEKGTSLVIFPEGTRSVKGAPGRFQRGAAYVLLASRCPLLLATIEPRPLMLAKHEKWYQIPASRPHFTLNIEQIKDDNIELYPQENPTSARQLTRMWRDYFISKVDI